MTNPVVNCNAKGILETMGQVHEIKPPKPAAISTDFEWVTPAKAAEWLAANTENQRSISQTTVQRYINDMRNGLWESDSHQAIAFDKDGKLVDGQHRLSALTRANVSLWLKVDRYSGPAPMASFDVGRKRTPGDALVVSGFAEKSKGRGIAACAAALKKGVDVTSSNPSSAVVAMVYEAHQAGIDAATRALPMAIASIQAAFAYLYPAAPEEVDRIMTKVAKNVGLVEDTGEQLLSLLLRNRGMRSQTEYAAAFYRTLTACEAAYKNKSIQSLRAPNAETLRKREFPPSLVWANKMRAARGQKLGSAA